MIRSVDYFEFAAAINPCLLRTNQILFIINRAGPTNSDQAVSGYLAGINIFAYGSVLLFTTSATFSLSEETSCGRYDRQHRTQVLLIITGSAGTNIDISWLPRQRQGRKLAEGARPSHGCKPLEPSLVQTFLCRPLRRLFFPVGCVEYESLVADTSAVLPHCGLLWTLVSSGSRAEKEVLA